MITYIVNLDTQPDRWATTQDHLAQWPHLDLHRWSATPADTITVTNWDDHYQDPARRVAIIDSYQRLLASLEGDGPWLILQDDIRFTEDPHRNTDTSIHLYGGYRLRPWRTLPDGTRTPAGPYQTVDPTIAAHVCPQAFLLRRPAVQPILDALAPRNRSMCNLWVTALADATWDNPPTAEPTGPCVA